MAKQLWVSVWLDNNRGPGVPDGWVADVCVEDDDEDGWSTVDSFCWYATKAEAVAAALVKYPDAEV